jgi:fumarate hydratase subunit alpha
MRPPTQVSTAQIADSVAALYRRTSVELRPDVTAALQRALANETSEMARGVLAALLENAQIAPRDGVPLCQDTGTVVAFVRLGAEVTVTGGTLQDAVDQGVRRAVAEQPLRASIVLDPLDRRNSGDNTPAVLHVEHVPGRLLEIHLLAKGGGAEGMSRLHMLTPSEGRRGVVDAVVDTVRCAGARPCPPLVVGVGIGGNFETAPLLAKRALLRDLGAANADSALAELEADLLARVNALGIGPQGFGGRTTALAVLCESAPCHITCLPVAVNLECHAHRHGTVTLGGGDPPARSEQP